MGKNVYLFGNGKAEGKADMKNLLGGKGANLAEMNLIGVPVPPGFTITTEVCTAYYEKGEEATFAEIKAEVENGIKQIEQIMGTSFGSSENPCLVSVRSGARVSMPGMMDTVLNLGLNDQAVEGLIKKTGNERFVWDSYRRFIQMYGDVVMEMKPESKDAIDLFEEIIENIKQTKKVNLDTDLEIEDLKEMVIQFKDAVKKNTGKEFPTDPWEQLWGAVTAVFRSWQNERAVLYRELNDIPAEWGTAVNVQAMVFGNMGVTSATGVAFTRDAATGENLFNGEYLVNAQGEDVVAGTRTPQQITTIGSKRWAEGAGVSEQDRSSQYSSLEELMPNVYKELDEIQQKLEDHYSDMQDIEFTIQEGKLWLLQTRSGKRTGMAMVKIAMDLWKERKIDEKELLLRQEATKLDELLHPIFRSDALKQAKVLAKGLAASPGAATGKIVFHADEAQEMYEKKKAQVILVRIETSPEDLGGMNAAQGILTARGGMTSHAAVVARGMGKCCVSGAGELNINYKKRTMTLPNGAIYKEGDWISLNGSTGEIYEGQLETQRPELGGDFDILMELSDKYSTMKVRTNADNPNDADAARKYGAEGIGLCRTEHMFFEGDRIYTMREMILASDKTDRQVALDKLLPLQREDFEGIFRCMSGYGVTIRLLDPPLHEFVPHQQSTIQETAERTGISVEDISQKVHSLQEFNPMLGHRGCRLGNTYPEITAMQARAIAEAALNVKKEGLDPRPEIMVPLVGNVKELEYQKKVIVDTIERVFQERGDRIDYQLGTMIEVPRAALTAAAIAKEADFFSFGTNDLTQMTMGFSRDDAGEFLKEYKHKNIIEQDPFETLDAEGVGQLVEIACKEGRRVKPELKLGICGEHGGDPDSIQFCYKVGLDYVSCSPFRVPIARLAAAQAVLKEK